MPHILISLTFLLVQQLSAECASQSPLLQKLVVAQRVVSTQTHRCEQMPTKAMRHAAGANNEVTMEDNQHSAWTGPGTKRRKAANRLTCRANKSKANVSNINKKCIANNTELAVKVARLQGEHEKNSSDIEEEKKEGDLAISNRRNPPHTASQNSSVVINEFEFDDALENRIGDANCFEDLSRGRMKDELFVHPADKLGRNKINFDTGRGRRMGTHCFHVNVHHVMW